MADGKHRPGPGKWSPKVSDSAPGREGTKGPSETRRRGAQHEARDSKPPTVPAILGGTPAKAPAKKAAPKKAAPKKAAPAKAAGGKLSRAADAARDFSNSQAVRMTGGRPSVTGRAAGGAAAGVAAGAALGGPAGAVAGGTIGGVGGALAGRKAKKAYDMAAHSHAGARRLIIVEFLLCMVVAGLTPITDEKKQEGPGGFMKRMTAIMGVFLLLGLLSAAGRGSARFAAGLGGVITVALVISNRSVFMTITRIFEKDDRGGAALRPVEDDGEAALRRLGTLGGAE